ncbi:50S ribosomal protein acetyltransferase [Candidatus Rhodobacter oscarellae]|uniref:50S ribosomal protein acetyltransferase n=1 Tax=Candidatus Rhodobacter oscarellae TaxID=1675527 RepID=A0A0J9E440_9RHOB|nr:GNAT family N-acetyltransferase [Candidatus Rhodobacter lobularis]KMW57581.1 50S ribosomal protein acetyltransferase [Candidatus Rhodobacter lobularis]
MTSTQDIETARLALRMLRPEDAPWIAREIANPAVHRWLTSPPCPYTEQDGREFIEMFQDNPRYRVITQGGAPLGVISMGDTKGPSYELGYWLRQSAWGQGIMSEAARALVDWHWQRSKAPLISGWVKGNAGSAQILTQLGFTYTKEIKRWVNFFGEDRDLICVRLEGPHVPLFTCRTERLVLNAVTLEDLPVIHREHGRPETARMLASAIPNWTLEQARDWLTGRLVPGRQGFSRAIRLHDGTYVGSIGCGGPEMSLGYVISKAHCGQGYVTEALRAFLPAAFAQWQDLDEITADAFTDNPASARILEKLGFEPRGQGMGDSKGRLEPAPVNLYRLTRAQMDAMQ